MTTVNKKTAYPGLSVTASSRDIITVVNQILQGKTNNSGVVTLQPNAGETTVQDSRVTSNSVILLTPLTASATGASAYVIERTNGSFKIAHMVAPASDCEFAFAVIG
jgi:hypothetical protein